MKNVASERRVSLVDTHCHLNFLDLQEYNGQLNLALEAARTSGVGCFVSVGVDPSTQWAVLDIAEQFSEVYATVGVHPNHVQEQTVDWVLLEQQSKHPKVVAIGETGLDYHYTPEHKRLQQESFQRHLELARSLQLPVVVHTREAADDTLSIIQDSGVHHGVMHCFTEDWECAKKALNLGFYISFSGVVSFKNATALREVARKVPSDRIVVETDSPWLAPVPFRGKSNQPAWVYYVASVLAEVRGCSLIDFAEQTTQNARQLFALKSIE